MAEVIMYCTTFCPYCVRAKMLLSKKGVEYTEINLDEEPHRRQEMIEKSGGGRTVPQIFIDGKPIGGFDDMVELQMDGVLDDMLGVGEKESSTEHHKVVILGSGPAGLTAAIYAGRANLKPVVVAGNEPGGQLTITTEVENFPGYPDGVQGPEMMEQLRKQAERFNTGFKTGNVREADLSNRPFRLTLDSNETITCDALIVATGASAKWLGLESETRLRNKGVSACATCDGFFFRDKPLAVVGGGDTALEEALYLTNFATKVTLIHRRDELRGSKVMQERAERNDKIEFLWNSQVAEVLGDDQAGVTGLKIKNTKTGEESDLKVDGLFVAIGHQPNTDLFQGKLDLDEQGYIRVTPGRTTASVEGVFVAGDAADPIYRQAITAAGTGCMAAIDAERWLATQE